MVVAFSLNSILSKLPPAETLAPYLRAIILINAVVVHTAIVPQGDGALARGTLGLPHQEGTVDARGEEVLGRVARDGAVVPRVLFQGVDRSDVVGGHPANLP